MSARSASLISRPGTLAALSLTVSGLTVAALLQSPTPAAAAYETTAHVTVDDSSTVATPRATGSTSRLARIVADRLRQQAAADRAHRKAVREARERRQERRERRQAARAAARAAAREPAWVMPVPGAGWSASYGEAGSAWSSGYHTGQDFTAPSGTPVRVVTDGIITSASWSDAYGNIIEVTHPNGDQSWYAHLADFERTSGQVRTGDVIGYVGCTGNCFGNHLHFEYHPGGGEAADPVAWLRRHGAY